MDDTSPIFLETDASDYSVGAYLYQVLTKEDGTTEQRPIAFISKATPADRSSWDIPKKEGFAIFYALKKWEYLLCDRQFTVRTDHQNLTRLKDDHDTNKMVKRWFMAYQEYDILEWQHVPGDENFIADAFSRLCRDESKEDNDNPKPHTPVDLYTLTGALIPQEAWDNISQVHNSREGHGGVETTYYPSPKKQETPLDRPGTTCTRLHPSLPVLPEDGPDQTDHQVLPLHEFNVRTMGRGQCRLH
jgi:hypothetical protein